MERILCIDIGGTSLKSAVYAKNGEKLTTTQTISVQNTLKENMILETTKEIVESHLLEGLTGVAISSAGVIDSERGVVAYAGYTIPNFIGTNFKEEIKQLFSLTCTVENDVNCAMLGEVWKRHLESKGTIVCLTIGTGIGGSILVDGQLLKGRNATAGEVGYMQVNQQNFQDIASTNALVSRVNKRTGKENLDGKQIIKLAKAGDPVVLAEVDDWLEDLVSGIVNIIYLLSPEKLILGGGIMEQKEFFQDRINQKLAAKMIDPFFNSTELQFAELGNEAGMIGALRNFLNLPNS